jgi:N-acetylglucosamine-6-phosphate deacetylase
VTRRSESEAFLIEQADIVLPDRVVRSGVVLVAGGKIRFAGPAKSLPKPIPHGCLRISAEGALACPALWEPHLHGCGGVSTEDMNPQSLMHMARVLASRGVGAFLPTTVSDEGYLARLGDSLRSTDDDPLLRGRVPGIHVEGPFVASTHRGAIPENMIRPPSMEYLDRMVSISGGRIRIMTFAPELPSAAALADRLRALGILPSLGHSAAPYDALSAFEGLSPLSVTHLFNGMSGVSHKEPGLAHWALLNREVFTELNCDGTHVNDAAVRLALRARPWERIVVISDAVAPAGLPPQKDGGVTPERMLYGRPLVERGNGVYYADTGVLVGSLLLVPDCIGRLIAELNVPVASAVAMATLNPARLLGFPQKGALMTGYDADVALFSRDFKRCSFLSWEGRVLHDETGPAGRMA